jgi:hypothetical protein
MSISSITSNLAASRLGFQSNVQAARKDFGALSSDLQSNNLAAAQQDFAAMLQDSPQLQAQLQNGQGTPSAAALGSLSTSLQSGDLAGAQAAMTSLKQAMHHHHHHHSQAGAGGGAMNATNQAASTPVGVADNPLTAVLSSASA